MNAKPTQIVQCQIIKRDGDEFHVHVTLAAYGWDLPCVGFSVDGLAGHGLGVGDWFEWMIHGGEINLLADVKPISEPKNELSVNELAQLNELRAEFKRQYDQRGPRPETP